MNQETWNTLTKKQEVMSEEMTNFLKEIDYVCKKHDFSISHEDQHGGFIIERYDKGNIEWLNFAMRNY